MAVTQASVPFLLSNHGVIVNEPSSSLEILTNTTLPNLGTTFLFFWLKDTICSKSEILSVLTELDNAPDTIFPIQSIIGTVNEEQLCIAEGIGKDTTERLVHAISHQVLPNLTNLNVADKMCIRDRVPEWRFRINGRISLAKRMGPVKLVWSIFFVF